MAKSEEELRVQIEYNVSGRQVNYVLAAILSLGGYGFYSSGDINEKVSRYDKQSFVKLQSDVREIQLEMKIFSAMMAKKNRKIIEKNDRPILNK